MKEAFPFVPNGTGELAVNTAETGVELIPDIVVQVGVIAILAYMTWRLYEGFRKNQKNG